MSLFQVREWWGIKCGENEEFDQDHLIVGNIDNDPNNVDKIITASLEGIIRIYLPTKSEYKVQDLILELDLKQPILQIALGKFLSNDKSNFLAVLHSRQLCVYSVNAIGGFGDKAQYYDLIKKYNHNLDRNAFNFIYGPFGERQEQYIDREMFSDSICVQSLDGKFWVFQQEHFSFARDWNNFLIPGCIIYVEYNDSIITMTADMKLYSYSYAVLSTSEQQKLNNLSFDEEKENKNEKNERNSKSKSFHKNWCINLCDHAIRIICARFTDALSRSDVDIIVLCEKSLFVISTNGIIKWQKKLDYNPSTMISYKSKNSYMDNSMDNVIIGNFQNSISIYSNCKLIWSSRLMFSPIDIRIGSFGGIAGFQIILSDDGYLMIGYLGTDPSGYKPIHVENDSKNMDWQQIETDMKYSKDTIEMLENNNDDNESMENYITIDIDNNYSKIEWIENGYIINEKYNNELICDSMKRIKSFKTLLIIKYEGRRDISEISDIQITILTNDAFICNQPFIHIDSMNSNCIEFELVFYCKKTVIANNCECNIYIIYLSGENDRIQTNQLLFELPFNLFLYASKSPIKNTNPYSVTLEISNQSTNKLLLPTQLFSDIVLDDNNKENPPDVHALTLIFYCHNYDITLLLSRKGNRIRIQCGDENKYIISIILNELIRRLNKLDIKITLKDNQLPSIMDYYFENMRNRYNIFQQIKYFENNLEKLSNQFRVIQKRLLMRYKNKNPTPLNEMDTLLKLTYENIINDTNQLEKLNNNFLNISGKLWGSTKLATLLIKLQYKLDHENTNMLSSFLSIGGIQNEINQGWEEQIEASMVYTLTTCLAKSIKDKKISQHKIGKLKDINKLIRHIQIVCHRIDKGQRFTDNPSLE